MNYSEFVQDVNDILKVTWGSKQIKRWTARTSKEKVGADDEFGIRLIVNPFDVGVLSVANAVQRLFQDANTFVYGKAAWKGFKEAGYEHFDSSRPHYTGYHGACHLKYTSPEGKGFEVQITTEWCHDLNEETHDTYKRWVATKDATLLRELRREWASRDSWGDILSPSDVTERILGWRLLEIMGTDVKDDRPYLQTIRINCGDALYNQDVWATTADFLTTLERLGFDTDEFFIHRHCWQGISSKRRRELADVLNLFAKDHCRESVETYLEGMETSPTGRAFAAAIRYMLDNRKKFKALFRIANKGKKRVEGLCRGQCYKRPSVPPVACYTTDSSTAVSFASGNTIELKPVPIKQVWSCWQVWQTAHQEEYEWTLYAPPTKKACQKDKSGGHVLPVQRWSLTGELSDSEICTCDNCIRWQRAHKLEHMDHCDCKICVAARTPCECCGVMMSKKTAAGQHGFKHHCYSCCLDIKKQLKAMDEVPCVSCCLTPVEAHGEKCNACILRESGEETYYITMKQDGATYNLRLRPELNWAGQLTWAVDSPAGWFSTSRHTKKEWAIEAFRDRLRMLQTSYMHSAKSFTTRMAVYNFDTGWQEVTALSIL